MQRYWLVLLACVGCDTRPGSHTSSQEAISAQAGAITATVPEPVVSPPRPKLPAEPAAPVASLAHEVPDLEAKLAADAAYQSVFTGDAEARNAFLTAVAQLVAQGGMWSPVRGEKPSAFLDEKKLKQAAINIYLVFLRTNRFPSGFDANVRKLLETGRELPRRGTWAPASHGSRAYDFTALGVLAFPEDPGYLRELLAARAHGFMGWQTEDPKRPWVRPYLVDQVAALERLKLLDALTADEQSVLAEAKRPRLRRPFQLGEFRFVVDGVEATDTIGSGLAMERATKGGLFVVVTHRIENKGTATATVRIGDLRLVDKANREFAPSSRAAAVLALSGEKDFVLAELQPGLEKTLRVAFEVPADVVKGGVSLVIPEKFGGTEQVVIPIVFGD